MTKKTKQIINELQNKLERCVNEIESISEKLNLAYKFINLMQDKIIVNVNLHYMLYGNLYSIHVYYIYCGRIYEVSNYIPQSTFVALDMVDNLKTEIISNNNKYIIFSVLGKNNEKFTFVINKDNNTLMEYPDMSNVGNNRG